MKTNIIITLALVMGMMLAGCSKEDDQEEMVKFTIDMEQVSILVGDDYKVTPSGAFTARSTDEDVATVSAEGIIHGVSAGDADVIFTSTDDGQEQTCKVSVDWRYKYFEEPVIAFGATKEEIKARETHEVSVEDGEHISYYYNQNTEIQTIVFYYFGTDGRTNLISLAPYGIRYEYYDDKMVQQITERYGNPSESSNNSKVFNPSNRGFIVRYHHRIGGGSVEYIPNGNN